MPDVRSFNIEAFKAKFGDGAKLSLFYFQPQWPPALGPDIPQQDAIYLVKTAQFPSTTMDEATLNWQGFDWKYPTKRTYSDVQITFNVDKDAKIRNTFEKWSNLIHDPLTNFYTTHDVHRADQILQMVGYQGDVILEVTLHDAWPKDIGQIGLDYGAADIATFDVTFSYVYHEMSFTEKGGAQ